MSNLVQDVRYAVRMLLKTPGFTLVAVLTLALGIGANTAIFSVVEAVLLRGLGYREPERLTVVWEHNFKRGRKTNVAGPANYMRWKERNQSFEKLTAVTEFNTTVTGLGDPEQINAGFVGADYFETLGVSARLGRVFGPEHGQTGTASNVVILSNGYWKRRFGADANVLGKTFNLNSTPVSVIGVMPENFHGLINVDLWNPIAFGERHRNAQGRYLVVVGRLKPGVTRDRAQTEMEGIAKQIETELPDFTRGWGVNVVPLREQLTGEIKPALLILMGAVGFVLLIACSNVANLALARATARHRELAVRTALGASRGHLVRQLLTESLLLALVGGAAGWVLAVWAVAGLETMLPPDMGRFTHIELNATVLGFTLALTVFTGVLFGVAPALAATRGRLQDALREGGAGGGTGARRLRLRDALVVSEVALSLVLLVGAGLLLKSFSRLNGVDAGFQAENVLSLSLSLPGATYNDPVKIVQYYDRVMAGVETLPGVSSAGAMSWQLLGGGSVTSYRIVGAPMPPLGQEPAAEVRMVTPRLFETLRIPLLRGRLFTGQETREGPRQVVVSSTLAREHWPDDDPIGKRIAMSWWTQIEAEVIGVVGDVRLAALDTKPRAVLYWAQSQMANNFMTVMVRSNRDPAQLTGALKAHIASVDPQIPVAKVRLLDTVKAESLNQRRFTVLLLGIFAGVAVLMAAVGIYGVMAYSVSQRTHEFGIRMALGAQPGDVLGMVLRGGAVLAGVGLAIGLGAAFGLTRFLQTLLFEVSVTDPGTFAAVSVLLALVALAACFIPARRATRVDPMVALRYE